MKPNSYSVQTQPKLGPQAVALTTSKAGSCYIGGLNVNIDLCAEIRLSCICSMTYRTQRQRGENGPSLGNGIGHDFFSASEGRNEMRRESILLRYDLRSSSKPLSCLCSSWRLTLQGLVRGFDRDRVSQVVSLDAFLFWRRC